MNAIEEWEYGVDTIGFIRQALAGYVGRSSITSEMLQNADDAKAAENSFDARTAKISFHFRPDALVIRNNSRFTDEDFRNISSISSGGKEHEEGKIGTWGTGFLSVYHLTDSPELLSSGKHFIFNPKKNRIRPKPTDVVESTEFRLRWRRTPTELSKRLKARSWSDEDIQQLKEEMITDAYRLLIHLRHVNLIEIFEGDEDEKLLCRVERIPIPTASQLNADFAREVMQIEYRRSGVQPRTDTWLYYRADIPRVYAVDGVTIKDFQVSFAFPVENRAWLVEHVPAVLYNFLPTPISTGLGFQINGAFFPDNNRRGILTDSDTHPQESKWNQCVIQHIGKLFADAVEDIRDQVPEPRRFYELLPIGLPVDPTLQPIRDVFVKRAPTLPIVLSSLKQWCRPNQVYIPSIGSKLPEIASDYLDILPNGAPLVFRNFLIEEMKSPPFTWRTVVGVIAPALETGTILVESHPMIATRDRLCTLYSELRSLTAQDEEYLSGTALCLAEDGTIRCFDDYIWRGNVTTRRLLADTGVLFVDDQANALFPALFNRLLEEFRGADLVSYLSKEEWPETPFPILNAPKVLGDVKHLAELVRFIHSDLNNVDADELATLPLVRTESDCLVCGLDDVYLANNSDEQHTLALLELDFVNKASYKDEEIRAVYRKAGVDYLSPRYVIEALRNSCGGWDSLPQEEILENLLSIYRYFSTNSTQLQEGEKTELRRLPLCLTQKGHLRPAKGGLVELHRPMKRGSSDDKVLKHLNNLQLDHLLHSDLVTRDESNFLKSVLQVKPLNSETLILDVILPYYLDTRLTDEARLDLADYVGERMRHHGDDDPDYLEIWRKLCDAQLIRCADGKYRRGVEAYFASPVLDTVFSKGYAKLHESYGVPIPEPDDSDQKPYVRSQWYWLFDRLKVNELPRPLDLVSAVKQIAASPPTEGRIDQVRRIYELLTRETGKGGIYSDGAGLEPLATIEWLPVRHDIESWYLPRKIYQASQADLIGEQEPLLASGFREATKELRDLLGMPSVPSVSIVANHLLASAKQSQEIKRRVYDNLGQRWEQIDSHTRHSLRVDAVVWDPRQRRYWPARNVFFESQHKFFGGRRCYLSPPGDDAEKFLVTIGVKSRPKFPDDHVSFVSEIADAYADGERLSEDDRKLLLANLSHLGSEDLTHYESHFVQLRREAAIPGRDGRLYTPDQILQADQPDLLNQFEEGAFPVVDDTELTESAFRFLRVLDVPLLSERISRRLADAKDKSEAQVLGYRLQRLSAAFHRIAVYLSERQGDYSGVDQVIEKLSKIRLFSCSRLLVEYVLNCGEHLYVEGHRSNEPALYDGETNCLYVQQDEYGELPMVELALELEKLLFPNSKQSFLIERLLTLPAAEVDSFLDRHKIRRLHQEQTAFSDEQSDVGLSVWVEPEDQKSLLEQVEKGDESIHTAAVARASNADASPKKQSKQQEHHSQQTSGISAAKNGTGDGTSGLPYTSVPTATTVPQSNERYADASGSEEQRVASTEQQYREGESLESQEDFEDPVLSNEEDPENRYDEEDEIPIFDGQLRPTVPVLPNIRRELEQFGFSWNGDEPILQGGFGGRAISDAIWVPTNSTGDKAEGRIWRSRFTLTFTQRYEGYLPLHASARKMMEQVGSPRKLHCQTNVEEWSFELYVDYVQGIIYNREDLPAFFDAFNIPAGGIVYLELLHGKTVRLFWNRVSSRLTHVRGLESEEGGSFEEYEIPEVEFECEIDDQMLRAEKRLEDLDALFGQAIGKRGIFQTICNVFGDGGAVLTFDEIFKAVLSHRMVSKAAIRTELSQRPCFVALSNNQWRFEPERGDAVPAATTPTRTRATRAGAAANGKQPKPQVRTTAGQEHRIRQQRNQTNNLPPQKVSLENQLVDQARRQLESLYSLLQSDGKSPHEQLTRLAEALVALGQRLQSDLRAFSQTVTLADEYLHSLWEGLERDPADKVIQQKLRAHLWEGVTRKSRSEMLARVSGHLAHSQPEWRENFFFPLLSDLADKAFKEQQLGVARELYQFLKQQGGGEFQAQIAKLEQEEGVQNYVDVALKAGAVADRWALWMDAWQTCPQSPKLRQAIQEDLDTTAAHFEQSVTAFLQQGDTNNAFESCINLIEGVGPLSDVWRSCKNADRVWRLLRMVFSATVEKARALGKDIHVYQQALQVLKPLPFSEAALVSVRDVFEAISEVSKDFEDRSHTLAAAALIDYGLAYINSNKQVIKGATAYQAYDRASMLYEQIQLFDRAYYHLSQIVERHLWKHLPNGKFNALNHRRFQLRQKARFNAQAKFKSRIDDVLKEAEFSKLVNTETLRFILLS